MKFCPKCRSILIPSKGKLSCACGYNEKAGEAVRLREEIRHTEIEIIDETQENLGDAAVDDIVCNKCGHHGAYTWFVQMRRSDEGVTRFFRCRKCKAVWRSNR
jgi:transcription factor S